MKIKNLVLMFSLAAVFAACQNENEPKDTASKPRTTGDCRIIIEGDETLSQSSRSSGTIQFEGGSASGAGLYDSSDDAIVSATPDPGYEIEYFYGGPAAEPRKYDNANGGATSFRVAIDGLDHVFHVGFQEKKGTLTVIAEEGGTVSPTGTTEVQRDVEFPISAIPNSGYEFAGWKINSGEITIANQNSANTTATLIGINSTITASFKEKITYKTIYCCAEIRPTYITDYQTGTGTYRVRVWLNETGNITPANSWVFGDTFSQCEFKIQIGSSNTINTYLRKYSYPTEYETEIRKTSSSDYPGLTPSNLSISVKGIYMDSNVINRLNTVFEGFKFLSNR